MLKICHGLLCFWVKKRQNLISQPFFVLQKTILHEINEDDEQIENLLKKLKFTTSNGLKTASKSCRILDHFDLPWNDQFWSYKEVWPFKKTRTSCRDRFSNKNCKKIEKYREMFLKNQKFFFKSGGGYCTCPSLI